ncbi:MAG: TIGR02757 family protein [Bacteroidetes bacterium GWF2_49_14]|nr:MAG: TIGR02757 family protein [Bacteroidetes bacterium GWF2_49_14]HBB90569.1 TIGR02757 family protein [Bacteroidales bacterium]
MGTLTTGEIRDLLDAKHDQYNHPGFIPADPISIPHSFTRREDIEISAFLTATIAWGNRASILRSAGRIMDFMDRSPFEFIMNYGDDGTPGVQGFVHRTFNGADLDYFFRRIRFIYSDKGGLEQVFLEGYRQGGIHGALDHFRQVFISSDVPGWTARHVSDVGRGSAAKRLNLFLMWMVRYDRRGVHFGLWKGIPAGALMIPLDTHVGRVARELGLLKRKGNDWQAVEELTAALRKMDPEDPCKYDFSLFGLGIFDKF